MYKDLKGYILVGTHLKLHRLIMEAVLERKLKPTEHIHHKDGNISNNNISNLKIVNASEHLKIHKREIQHKHFDLNWLEKQLETRTQRDIAKECGVSAVAIGNYIDRYLKYPECKTWTEYYRIKQINGRRE